MTNAALPNQVAVNGSISISQLRMSRSNTRDGSLTISAAPRPRKGRAELVTLEMSK
jgi:hypothetical protein